MHGVRIGLFFFVCFLFGGFLAREVTPSETFKAEVKKGGSKPLVIKSKSIEVDNAKKVVVFTGEVNAVKDDFVIDCDKMLVYYTQAGDRKGEKEPETKIDKIVATGQVKINRTQGGVATAEKAVYYQNEEKVILTGNPVVRQGNDTVEGERITIFLEENRSIVESSEDRKVKAVIFPKSEKE